MKKSIPILLLVLLSLSVPSGQAGAAAVLSISDGPHTFNVVDGSPSDINPLTGVITFNGPVGSWIVNVTTGITKPVLGSNTAPTMDLSSVNVTSAAGGWLALGVSDTEFSYSGKLTTSFGGTTHGFIEFFTAVGNDPFKFGELSSGIGPFWPVAFSGSQTNTVDLSPVDWLTIGASISHSGAYSSSFNEIVQPIPVPGMMILLGIGLVGMAAYGRRRFKK